MSKYNKQIINNSILSIIQIVVVSICSFFLYKYIIVTLGLEKLGLWSLILSVTSLASLGNFGFTGSLIKFSAELSTLNEYKKINAILNTSIIGVSGILIILLSLVFILGYNFIGYFVDEKWVIISKELLFYALISLFLNIIAGLYFSILEGLNMAYLKSLSFITATIIYVVFSVIFIDIYDVIGLAYAQLIQASIFLISGILLSIIYISNFRVFYFKWHKNLMKEVFNYGMSFQVIGISQMLYDPITKAILSRYGGLDFVAIFEMASKLVIQVRGIASKVIQNVVPKIVKLSIITGDVKIFEAYKKIHNINMFLIFVSLALIIPFSNIISIILLGNSNHIFIIVLIILTLGWMINSLNIPSYIINLGRGDLKWNVIAHLTIGVLNLIFCYTTGLIFKNGFYIIFSWVFALIIGSLTIIIEYHKRNQLSYTFIFNKVFFKLIISFSIFAISSYIINTQINNFLLLFICQSIISLAYCSFVVFKIKGINNEINRIYKTRLN